MRLAKDPVYCFTIAAQYRYDDYAGMALKRAK
jgi:hypothetical protein